jgi:putative transposase
LGLIDEAIQSGARQRKACEILGLDPRTVQRWKDQDIGEDCRMGPRQAPRNKLAASERREVLEIVNQERYRDLSVKQIVPRLADEGTYLASESTMYRILREEDQLRHRGVSQPRTSKAPRALEATGANQVWSWDISLLRSPIRGAFYYLYLVMDVWSRKIVGAAVHTNESAAHAAALIDSSCRLEGVLRDQLALHSDNGGPMKGATMLATLQRLGVMPSFSRPRVSDDNPYSEALFRTLKYCPQYPEGPFLSLETARTWVESFVSWYNGEHLHSGIRFVTPQQRHQGEDVEILANRTRLYRAARRKHPERWARGVRNWSRNEVVKLNPKRNQPERRAA